MIEIIDFKGRVFPSKTAMCKEYGIPLSAYNRRIKRGWSQEQALTTPLKNGKGYDNYVRMCKLYHKNHEDEIREMNRQYRETHKKEMKLYQKRYRDKKKKELENLRKWKRLYEEQFSSVN